MIDSRRGWHFLPPDRKLRLNHFGPAIVPGRIVRDTTFEPRVGAEGFHAGTDLASALFYCYGPWLCDVTVSGQVADYYDDNYRLTLVSGQEREVHRMVRIDYLLAQLVIAAHSYPEDMQANVDWFKSLPWPEQPAKQSKAFNDALYELSETSSLYKSPRPYGTVWEHVYYTSGYLRNHLDLALDLILPDVEQLEWLMPKGN
jgi:hypothetical protein